VTSLGEREDTLKVQIHEEIFSCNFGLMIQTFHEQLAGDNISCYVSVFHVSHECFHNEI
jgi:hypothetical protein